MKKVILSMAFIMACSLVAAQSESNITLKSQLNNLLKSGAGAPKSKLSTTMLKIGLVF